MSRSSARKAGPEQIAITEFKARCLALVEDVRREGRELVITRHGRPVARVTPVPGGREEWTNPFGAWRDRVRIRGDIVHSDWSQDFDATRDEA
jgi:prevent-host-death family protein